jgi:hypothetical protein
MRIHVMMRQRVPVFDPKAPFDPQAPAVQVFHVPYDREIAVRVRDAIHELRRHNYTPKTIVLGSRAYLSLYVYCLKQSVRYAGREDDIELMADAASSSRVEFETYPVELDMTTCDENDLRITSDQTAVSFALQRTKI